MQKHEIHTDEPMTIVEQHEVEDQYELEFKKIVGEFTKALENFSGFLGKNVLHTKLPGKTIYYILMRFDNLQHSKQWEESAIHAQLLAKLHALIGKKPEYHYLTGLESWFSLGVNKPMLPPPRYKMALLIWASVYSLLLLIFMLFGKVLSELPVPVRFLLISMTLVGLLTYVILPYLTRVFENWLYPKK